MSPPDAPRLAPVPRDGGPAFTAPWQARAFALTVLLHERGVFEWREWAEALAAENARPSEGLDGGHAAWLRALTGLLAARGIVAPEACDGPEAG